MVARHVVLIRHGESVGNVAAAAAYAASADVIDLDRRDADVPLSATGVEQAQRLGQRWSLEGWRPDAVFSSPYRRVRQTARTALDHAGLDTDVVLDERLRDRELGILDTLTLTGVETRHPSEALRRRWLGKFYHRPPGGESYPDLILRVRSFLRDLPEGPQTVVMCHDAVVLAFRYVCEGLTEDELLDISSSSPVHNVSLTTLR